MGLSLTGRESGNRVNKPGIYHAAVTRVDDSFNKMDKVIVEFEILAGTVPDQIGKTHTEFFNTSDKALPRLGVFACSVGLLGDGESKEVELSQAQDRQLIIQVEDHSYKDANTGEEKKSVRLAYDGMWRVGGEKAPQCPLCEKAAKVAGVDAAKPAVAAATTGGSNWNDV